MKKPQKGFAFEYIIFAVVIIVIAAVAVTLVLTHKNKNASNATNNTSSSSQTSSNNQATNPYAGWKTYCDTGVKACFKYPPDWVVSQYGGFQNSACTEYASLVGPTSKDTGDSSAYIDSISDLGPNNPDLKVLGLSVDNKPSYMIYNASYINDNDLKAGGTYTIAYINHRFTGKTGAAGLTGTPCANGYAAITSFDQAKAWFASSEAKMVLQSLQSFYYQ